MSRVCEHQMILWLQHVAATCPCVMTSRACAERSCTDNIFYIDYTQGAFHVAVSDNFNFFRNLNVLRI